MTENGSGRVLELLVNGHAHSVPDRGDTLLDVLRQDLGLTGAKDGCSPQGQCGCCTVLVDGQPRVACVTPARRVRGRAITTIEGLDEASADRWSGALCATGGSQCGFCTPGIVLRLEATLNKLEDDATEADATAATEQALLAHMCRCTGWQTITEAVQLVVSGEPVTIPAETAGRSERIRLEGGVPQAMVPAAALGSSGFAADTAPDDHLIAVLDPSGEWAVGDTLAEARLAAGKVQGRRTTMEHHHPIAMPDGDFVAGFQTTWTDPAYLETDASWCEPGGEPASALGNGGAFGGKQGGEIEAAARRLADRHGRPVLALWSREDVMQRAPKRPPFAGAIRADGTGVVRFAATEGIEAIVQSYGPEFELETHEIPGPETGVHLRGAAWAEIAVLRSALTSSDEPITVVAPNGAQATAAVTDNRLVVNVSAGPILDAGALRSYCIGAAHMGWSWATSEAMTVDGEGQIHDLTVRSLGILRAMDTPAIEIRIDDDANGPAVNGSDAVFAAAAAVAWRASSHRQQWPLGVLPR